MKESGSSIEPIRRLRKLKAIRRLGKLDSSFNILKTTPAGVLPWFTMESNDLESESR